MKKLLYNTGHDCIVIRVSEQPRGRPRSSSADAAILEAALEELIDRGLGAITIEQVARRAGVTRATIYRRFPDKTQLLIAALQAAHGDPPATPRIDSIEILLTGWSTVLSDPRQRRLLRHLYAAADEDPQLATTYRDMFGRHRDAARREVLTRAQQEGLLPAEVDPDVVLDILNGAVWQHLVTRPDTGTPAEVEQFLRSVVQQVGYRARAPKKSRKPSTSQLERKN